MVMLTTPISILAQFTQLKYTGWTAPINYEYFSPGGWISVPYGSVITVAGKLYGTTTSTGSGNYGTIFSVNPDGSDYTTLFEFNTGAGWGRLPFGSLVSDGVYLYGTTAMDHGTIFRINLDGTGFTTMHFLDGSTGSFPISTLILDGNTLYGVTRKGGANDQGTLFKIEKDGTGFAGLFDFDGTNGGSPAGDLLFDGTFFYGCTSAGGASNNGVIFRISTSGSGYTNLHDFDFPTGVFAGGGSADGNNGALVSDGTYLYGTNGLGGTFGQGNLFRIKPDGTGYNSIYDFGFTYSRPNGSLAFDGTFLYGTAEGTLDDGGGLFKIKPDGSEFATVLNFASEPNGNVSGSNIIRSGTTLFGITSWNGWNSRSSFNTDASVFRIETDGTGYANLHDFSGRAEGRQSLGKLTLVGSSLYGTSSRGGNRNLGNIFKIDADGNNYMLLRDFRGYTDGANPAGGLYDDGSFLYGLTSTGGFGNVGTIYKIAPDGTSYSILHEFTFPGGYFPVGELIPVGANLIGATNGGGFNGTGTIFKINPDGTGYTEILSFPSSFWLSWSLFYDGTFLYGMSRLGGSSNLGYIFRVLPDGSSFSNILNFDGTNGSSPAGNSLISDGSYLYGMTPIGGANNQGVVFKILPNGSGYAKLHDFAWPLGSGPNGALTLVGSYLYGLAGNSAMFKIKTDGSEYTHIMNFNTCSPIYAPNGTLIHDGTTFYGLLSAGLFSVREIMVTSFSPTSGPVGTPVTLNGVNLAASGFPSSTSFNGVAATQINTPTSISTMVPPGATSGPITVRRGCLIVNTANFNVTTSTGPIISSFSPSSGPIGTTVTITGTNFSATPASNIVYFGATRATVTVATATQLTVTVPSGATYEPISVNVDGLVGYSTAPFVVTFPGGGTIAACSFDPKVDFTTGAFPLVGSMGDLDGDGKVDLAVRNGAGNSVSLLRNTSSGPGNISYAAKVDLAVGGSTSSLTIGDLDGDGKLDVATANGPSNTLSVLLNNSTAGTLSYAPKVDFTTGTNATSLASGDLDGDGRTDLAAVNYSSNTVSIFLNTGTAGSIGFAPKVDFTTGTNPRSVSIGDLDGDGKDDLVVANYASNSISIFLNTGTAGSVGYAPKVDFTTGSGPFSISVGDLDGDGKPDLAVSNDASATVSVFRNTASGVGNINFAPKVDLASGTNPRFFSIGDLDGDGKVDLAVANLTGLISVFQNTSTIGSISYAAKVDFASSSPSVSIGDLDGDGKADLAAVNFSSSSISVLRNTIASLSTVTITSFAPATAAVGTSVNIVGTNFDPLPANNVVRFNGIQAIATASTTTTITVDVPAGATTGPIQVTIGCNTASSATNFVICSPPAAPGVTPADLCGSGTAVLGGTGTTDGNYRWYTVSSGGAAIVGEVNNTYTTPAITVTTTYYVSIVSGGCESTRSAVAATIHTPPADPVPTGSARCGVGSLTLSATGGAPGQFRWYSGGLVIPGEVNAAYTTPILTVTTSYEVSIHDGSCESNRLPIVATINLVPPAAGAVPATHCGAGSVSLAATGTTNGNYRWYASAVGGLPFSGEVNSTYVTPSISTTTSYFVALYNGSCESVSRTEVIASINSIPSDPLPPMVNGPLCSGSTFTFSTSGASPGEYRWYTVPIGGVSIPGAINDVFSTTLTTALNPPHYVSIMIGGCESGRQGATAVVTPLPIEPLAPNPPPVCAGNGTILVASGAANGNFRWYDGPSQLTGEVNGTLNIVSLSATKTFSVSIFDGTCESAKANVTASVQPCSPPVIASNVSAPFIPGIIRIDLTPLLSDPESNLDLASIEIIGNLPSGATATIEGTELVINYNGLPFPGIETVILKVCDLTGLCSEETVVTINLSSEIGIFNALSPNSDGKNEILFIENIDKLPDTQKNKLTIFDRWGNPVFEANNYDNTTIAFKGISSNGSELPSGTYYYSIEFSSGAPKRTGFISLRK